jgi:anaerobic dimethyl sulfoxide reductase subunit A
MREKFPQQLWMNPQDAMVRSIQDGDLVEVWNERGKLVVPALLTEKIIPISGLP